MENLNNYTLQANTLPSQWLQFLWRTTILVVFSLLLMGGKAMAQGQTPPDPGVGGTQAGFEIDADFKSGITPAWWNALNYSPPGLTKGDDWSKGPTGNAVLKQENGVSVPGKTADGRSMWQVDGNWGNNSAAPELASFAGESNKNGDNIAPGASPYSVQDGGTGPQKNDITNTYLHTREDESGDTWLFFGAETRATNGNSYLDFEYNQAGVARVGNQVVGYGPVNGRTENDFLLVINYTGGGNRPIVGVRKWQADGTWSEELPVSALGAFVTTNTAAIDPVAPNKGFTGNGAFANTVMALQFVEGGVNITDLDLGSINLCDPRATVTVKTRSSSSFTAELKDYDILNFPLIPAAELTALTSLTRCPGASAAFSTTVSGDGASAANVEWYFGNTKLSDGMKYSIAVVGNVSTLTVNNLVAGDAGTYTAKLTGATCGEPEESATLTMNTNVALTALSPQTKCPGENASFSTTVSGTGATGNDVRWYKVDGMNETLINTGISVDGLTSTLSLTNVSSSDAGTYRARIGGDPLCGSDYKDGTLTVKTNVALTALTNLTKCPGDNAVFSTTASGTGATGSDVSWYRVVGMVETQINSGISVNGQVSTLTISDVTSGDAGTYRARIGGGALCSSDYKDATLTVNTNVALTDLSPLTKCVGESAVFSSTASGTGATGNDIRWYKGMTLLSDGGRYSIVVVNNTSTLTISDLVLGDTDTYWAKIGGAPLCGSDEVSALLTVENCITDEGCTPGYWKNRKGDWSVYCGDQMLNKASNFNTTFGLGGAAATRIPSQASLTLGTALDLKGGGSTNGYEQLGRAGAAALFNAASIGYAKNCSEVKAMVKAGFEGTQAQALALAYELDGYNNAGCPIDAFGRPIPIEVSTVASLQGRELGDSDEFRAYPTPFTDKAVIEFTVAQDERFSMRLYDMRGALVRELKVGEAKAGMVNTVVVEGGGLPEGMYIARMVSDSGTKTVKLLKKE